MIHFYQFSFSYFFLNYVPFRHENNWCYWYLSFSLDYFIIIITKRLVLFIFLFYLMLRIWIGFYPAHLGYAVPFINLGLILLFEKPFVVTTTSSWSVVKKKKEKYRQTNEQNKIAEKKTKQWNLFLCKTQCEFN